MLDSLEEAALQAGYNVLTCQTNESYLRELVSMGSLCPGKRR